MLKNQGKTLLAALLCLCLAAPLQAADLVDIYRLAAEQDPQIQAAEAAMLAELENINQSRATLLPNISASANTQTIDRTSGGGIAQNGQPLPDTNERFNSNGYTARLVQPILRADRWFQLLTSKAAGEGAKAGFEDAKQELLIRVSEAYFNVLRAEDNLQAGITQEEALQRQLEQTQERFNVGLIAITDVHSAQAAYDLSRALRISLEEARDNSFAVLETLTGQSFAEIDSLDKEIPIEPPSPADLQSWVDLALGSNLALEAARHDVEAARQVIRREKSGHLPTLDAVVSYSHSEAGGRNFLGNETDQEIYGLELNVPIFAGGGTRSRVRQANHLLNQTKAQYENQYRTVRQNVQTQHRTVNSDVLRVGAQRLALRSSQSALEATEGGYEVGTRNIVDVLQARNTLFNSQRDYYNAIYDYVVNQLRLKRIAGQLSDQDLIELNSWLTDIQPAAAPQP